MKVNINISFTSILLVFSSFQDFCSTFLHMFFTNQNTNAKVKTVVTLLVIERKLAVWELINSKF